MNAEAVDYRTRIEGLVPHAVDEERLVLEDVVTIGKGLTGIGVGLSAVNLGLSWLTSKDPDHEHSKSVRAASTVGLIVGALDIAAGLGLEIFANKRLAVIEDVMDDQEDRQELTWLKY